LDISKLTLECKLVFSVLLVIIARCRQLPIKLLSHALINIIALLVV
jgi:hypothetical protein